MADGDEFVGGGIDEHPAAVEGETMFVEGGFGEGEPAAGFDGVDAEGDDGAGVGFEGGVGGEEVEEGGERLERFGVGFEEGEEKGKGEEEDG